MFNAENSLRSCRRILSVLALCVAGAVAAEDAGSLSLQQAVARALERNHDLKMARAAVASAQASVQSAGAAPNPQLGLSSSSIRLSGGNGTGSLWNKQIDSVVGVSQLIERGGKRELRKENAEHNVRAAADDLQDVRRQLRMLVAQTYADLHVAQDRLAATKEASLLLDATLAAAKVRRNAGDIAGADVERVRVDALRARNDLVAADAELRHAQQVLALLLVEQRPKALEAADSWPSIDAFVAPVADKLQSIIEQRADVRAAAARVDAAATGTKLAQSLRTRDVSVGLQYEHYPQTGDSGNSVGVSVQIPLFTSYYYEGEIGTSLAALDSARVNQERVRAAAEADINNALSALQSAADRVRRNRDELLVAAEKAAKAAEYAYQNGAVGVMDVLDARRTLRATRLDALAAQADFSKALAAWQAATETTEESTK
jgi:cobalt-zinc-cadmium efflux system outer membrane protein